MTIDPTDIARDHTCKHCGATGLTKGEQLKHGRWQKMHGQCARPEESAQPVADEQPIADEQPAAGPTLEEQINDHARNLTARPFIHRSTSWISSHGAERIARLVVEGGWDIDAAAREVLSGFAGWPEGGAR